MNVSCSYNESYLIEFVLDAEIFDVGQDRKCAKTSTCA